MAPPSDGGRWDSARAHPEVRVEEQGAVFQSSGHGFRTCLCQRELRENINRRKAMRKGKYESDVPKSRAAIMAEMEAEQAASAENFLPDIARDRTKRR